ncbi:medium-chain acyl-CoA ligase ACSF2, mitochondrial isoform X5 [Bacillus rossius redtenbacheri]|uniref:medium-chain acyl-CoA ligase ACSF2, mitochondrial isoform X5 n=1 Tax=Bacillus rossius redtenbacheri TaxID=93214 RepID=UPI002FDCC0CF
MPACAVRDGRATGTTPAASPCCRGPRGRCWTSPQSASRTERPWCLCTSATDSPSSKSDSRRTGWRRGSGSWGCVPGTGWDSGAPTAASGWCRTSLRPGPAWCWGTFQLDEVMCGGSVASQEAIKEAQLLQQPDEGCNIQFTSGTTGKPKATLLSHHNVVNNAYFFGKRLGLQSKPHRLCVPVPLFHTFGNTLGITTAWLFGATLVLPSAGFSAAGVLAALQQERCSVVYGTPTMHVDMLALAERDGVRLPGLELVLTSGAPTSPHLFREFRRVYGLQRVNSMYGMTETSPITFQPFEDTPTEKLVNTVGYVSEHTEVKVVDAEGRMVPLGSPGELLVRGYCCMLGYWQDEDQTRQTIGPDRWLRTGDQFVLLEDGYGRVVGRLKDMIIRGGENIFPREIEDMLQTHPDILEAQVLGVPDPRLGEVVCCFARLRPGASLSAQQLRAYCTGKIAHFKIPLHVRFVTSFPKTTSGKIQKFKLQEQLVEELREDREVRTP